MSGCQRKSQFHVIPWIKRSGEWLSESGIAPNQHVRIITLHPLFIIGPEQPPPVPKR